LDSHIDLLREDIARRIRPAMANTPDEEFNRLVARMAELQRKYENRERGEFFRFAGNC